GAASQGTGFVAGAASCRSEAAAPATGGSATATTTTAAAFTTRGFAEGGTRLASMRSASPTLFGDDSEFPVIYHTALTPSAFNRGA
ncbi:MAG: hypothetical protein M3R07_12900, partial [Gemmatimonadota bacterium]|nr:hypothetical protein [Gemmatimonadota bacterium]